MTRIVILGGYGVFGLRIATALARRGVPLVIVGRNADKAAALATSLQTQSTAKIESDGCDVHRDLPMLLTRWQPGVVVNTCGPFQARDYRVFEHCIAHGIHAIDLADGRDYVANIGVLDAAARARDVAVISGASTVPALTSAILSRFAPEFSVMNAMRCGITPGQRTDRGLATTQAILGYAGKPLKPFAGHAHAYGWLGLHRQVYPTLGARWMSDCDVPDLDLLPQRYGLRSIRFSAGLELGFLHLGLWMLAHAVKIGIPLDLAAHAERLLRISQMFDRFGSADGGMHVVMEGLGLDGRPRTRRCFILAKRGDGPQIPAVPATLLAERLAKGQFSPRGAMACLDLLTLDDYLAALTNFDITIIEDTEPG